MMLVQRRSGGARCLASLNACLKSVREIAIAGTFSKNRCGQTQVACAGPPGGRNVNCGLERTRNGFADSTGVLRGAAGDSAGQARSVAQLTVKRTWAGCAGR